MVYLSSLTVCSEGDINTPPPPKKKKAENDNNNKKTTKKTQKKPQLKMTNQLFIFRAFFLILWTLNLKFVSCKSTNKKKFWPKYYWDGSCNSFPLSQDFSTRSLNMSEESPVMVKEMDTQDEADGQDDQADLERFQMRRTWESR